MKTKKLIIVIFLSLIILQLFRFDSSLNSKVEYDRDEQNIMQIDDDLTKETSNAGIEMQDISIISTESTSLSFKPDLAIDSSGNLHAVWYDYTDLGGSGEDRDIFYKKKDAITGIWSSTEIISTESSGISEAPKLYVDSSDNIHIIWEDETDYNGAGGDRDIFYKKKDITTGIWSSSEVVSTESTLDSVNPSLVVDQHGYVYIVWTDFTNYESSGSDLDIFFKYRKLDGSWTPTEVISTESGSDTYGASLTIDSNRNLHLAWMDLTEHLNTGLDVDVFYRYRNIVTGDWTEIEIISKESNTDSSYPSLTVDIDDNLHVVWQDKEDYNLAGSDQDIFYKRKESSTKVWTTAEVISTESINTSDSADLWVTPSGAIHIVWRDRTSLGGLDTYNDIFYKYLDSSLEDWSSTHVISAELSQFSSMPCLVGDIAGNIHILWQSSDNYAGSGSDSDIFYRKLTHDLTNPVIQIESPSISQQFGEIAPIYKLIVEELHLKSISYVINNGPIYNIEDLIGTIDQTAWENTPNGFVSLKFIAEDHNGNIGEEEVIIIKDDPAISQDLEINILSPIMNQEFQQYAPAFEISIEGNYDSIWYILDEGSTEVIVADFKGLIDQDLWDICDNGYISLQFYTNNSLGTLYYDEIYILKNPILEVSLINLAYSSELFELTVSVCDSEKQVIENAQFETIWRGNSYIDNIESIGPGLYRILLTPIFIQTGESPILFECIVSAEGYANFHYKTYISIYSSEELQENLDDGNNREDDFKVFATLAGVILLLVAGMGIAIIPKYIIKRRKLKRI